MLRARADEAAVAVGAFDDVGLAHLEVDARMAEGAADAVAGDAAGGDGDDLGGRGIGDGHGASLAGSYGRAPWRSPSARLGRAPARAPSIGATPPAPWTP